MKSMNPVIKTLQKKKKNYIKLYVQTFALDDFVLQGNNRFNS